MSTNFLSETFLSLLKSFSTLHAVDRYILTCWCFVLVYTTLNAWNTLWLCEQRFPFAISQGTSCLGIWLGSNSTKVHVQLYLKEPRCSFFFFVFYGPYLFIFTCVLFNNNTETWTVTVLRWWEDSMDTQIQAPFMSINASWFYPDYSNF